MPKIKKQKTVKVKKSKRPAKVLPKPKALKMEKLIGKVSHYFSDIEVAVIKLSTPLSKGDEIRIVGGESTDFNQKVASMQIDHKEVKKAKKGNSVGLKTKEKVREGYKVYQG